MDGMPSMIVPVLTPALLYVCRITFSAWVGGEFAYNHSEYYSMGKAIAGNYEASTEASGRVS